MEALSMMSAFEHVRAGGRLHRSHTGAAERLRCILLLAGALAEPRDEVRPPRVRLLFGRRQPELRIRLVYAAQPITRPRVTRRVDERGDVPAGRQHKSQVLDTEQP